MVTKFYCDESITKAIMKKIKSNGFEYTSASMKGFQGIKDDQLMNFLQAENCSLLTFEKAFLRSKFQLEHGIIIIDHFPIDSKEMISSFENLLKSVKKNQVEIKEKILLNDRFDITEPYTTSIEDEIEAEKEIEKRKQELAPPMPKVEKPRETKPLAPLRPKIKGAKETKTHSVSSFRMSMLRDLAKIRKLTQETDDDAGERNEFLVVDRINDNEIRLLLDPSLKIHEAIDKAYEDITGTRNWKVYSENMIEVDDLLVSEAMKSEIFLLFIQ